MLLSLALVAFLMSGCQKGSEPSPTPGSATTATPSPAQPRTPFEKDLAYVRGGQFTYILVFSRKDGLGFSMDDINYLKANSPAETNQWISTDEGRRVIAGSNFDFKPEHLEALKKRFNIEDFSGK